MRKIKFLMTAEDYFYGVKTKQNALKFKRTTELLLLMLGIAAIVITFLFTLDASLALFGGLIIAFSLYIFASPTKKLVERNYNMSPFARRYKTILFDSESVSFISAFERIKMKWQDICAYRITDGYVYIQPVAAGEAYVIDRSKYACSELDELCLIIEQKCKRLNIYTGNESSPEPQNPIAPDSHLPFEIGMKLSDDDIFQNQRIAIKQSGFLSRLYFWGIFYCAFDVYTYIKTKDTQYLIVVAIILAIITVYALYNLIISPRLMAKSVKKVKINTTGAASTRVTFKREFFELINSSESDMFETDIVIPYAYISLVTETDDYYSIIATSEKNILIPKRYLTIAQQETITALFKEKCTYKKI